MDLVLPQIGHDSLKPAALTLVLERACPDLALPGYDPFAATGANVSVLVPNTFRDPISGTTPSRSFLCRVRPLEAPMAAEPAQAATAAAR